MFIQYPLTTSSTCYSCILVMEVIVGRGHFLFQPTPLVRKGIGDYLMHGIRRKDTSDIPIVTPCFCIQFGRPAIKLGHVNPNPMFWNACTNLLEPSSPSCLRTKKPEMKRNDISDRQKVSECPCLGIQVCSAVDWYCRERSWSGFVAIAWCYREDGGGPQLPSYRRKQNQWPLGSHISALIDHASLLYFAGLDPGGGGGGGGCRGCALPPP